MCKPITLKELYEKHPEWHNLELVVYCTDGTLDYINCAGSVYKGRDYEENQDVLVFSAN